MSAQEPITVNLDRLREAIEASLPAVQSKTKDPIDLAGERALEHQHRVVTIEGLREDNRNKKANRRLRWKYAKWVFRYLVIYSLFAAVVVILHGFGILGFVLPPIVLGALVGSTAVASIGLVASVVAGLFKSS